MRLLGVLILLAVLALTGCGTKDDRKATYFDRGMELYNAGDYQKAQLEFRNVLQIDPKHIPARYQLALTEEKRQNWQAAFDNYSAVLQLDAQNADAHIRLGGIYLLAGTPDKALEEAQTALRLYGQGPDALVLRAAAMARLGRRDEGIADAKSALAADSANGKARGLLAMLYADAGQVDDAVAVIEDGIATNPEDPELRIVLAQVYERAGAEAKVTETLAAIVSLQPQDLDHRLRLYAAYQRTGQLELAEATLRDAIDIAPALVDTKLTLVSFLLRHRGAEPAEQQLLEFVEQSPEAYRLQFGLARLYSASERPEDMVAVYRDIIERNGSKADGLSARRFLAEYYSGAEQFDLALVLIDEVLAENPNDSQVLVIRAGIHLEQRQPDKAIVDLRTVLRDNPNSAFARRLLGRAHAMKGDSALAVDSFRKALNLDPNDAEAYVDLARTLAGEGDADGAIAVFEGMLELTRDDRPVLQAMAQIRLQQDAFAQALVLAQRLKTEFPDRAEGSYYAGLALQGLERFEESVREFEAALALNPDSAEPLSALSQSLLASDQGAMTVDRLDTVLAQDPDNFLVQNLLGEVFGVMRQSEAAEAAFLKAKGMRPEWPVPYRNLASLYSSRGQNDKAIVVVREGIDATGGDASLRLQLGTLLEQDAQTPAAIAQYEDLLAEFPDIVVAQNNLAMLLIDGDPDQMALDRALSLVQKMKIDGNPYFRDTVGWVRYRRGEFAEAVAELEIAAGEAPDAPVIQYHLGMAYFHLGRAEKAKTHLQMALSDSGEFPGHQEARRTLGTL